MNGLNGAMCNLSSLFLFNTLTDFPGLEVNNSKNSSTFSKICEDQALHDILGFAVTKLNHLLPWSPNHWEKKSFNQCWKLIQPIEALLS